MKALLLTLFFFVFVHHVHADDEPISLTDVPVYVAALPKWHTLTPKVRLIVFSDHTATDLNSEGTEARSAAIQDLKDELGVDDALLKEFIRINAKVSTFPARILAAFGTKVVTISPEQISQLFKDGANHEWEVFYRKYPHSSGIVTVSRVAFNAAGDTALVYVGWRSGSLAGGGLYYLLHRAHNRWKRVKEISTWTV